ncbi:DUF6732 family protein [Jannaschia helgolandensis]|uniref:DUF6732 family protein n=2 Tax=Jannaschia helgolandensis TaxID=188906 RepID=UPI0030DCFD8E
MPTQHGGNTRYRLRDPDIGGISAAKGPPMRFLVLFSLTPLLLAQPAQAHVGHISDLGGHDHWALGIGLGVIVGAAVLGWIKGAPDDQADEEETSESPEEEEQTA